MKRHTAELKPGWIHDNGCCLTTCFLAMIDSFSQLAPCKAMCDKHPMTAQTWMTVGQTYSYSSRRGKKYAIDTPHISCHTQHNYTWTAPVSFVTTTCKTLMPWLAHSGRSRSDGNTQAGDMTWMRAVVWYLIDNSTSLTECMASTFKVIGTPS